MDDRLSRLESSVRALERSLSAVEQRVAFVETLLVATAQGGVSVPPPDRVPRDERTTRLAAHSAYDLVAILSLVGRTLVALGGAYFLRALTDSAVVRQEAGIALGLAYAMCWLVLCDRAAGGGRRLSGVFHAGVASMIAFPLLWEAVTRFRFLGPETSAAALTLITVLELAVALHRRLQIVAWMATVSALATLLALVTATGVVLPFAFAAIALGIVTLWIGYGVDWVFLRWPVAVIADMLVLALIARVSSRSGPDAPGLVIAAQLSLLTAYLASIAIRTLIRGRDVNLFEVVQAVAALMAGFGGAIYVARATGFGASTLALINLACGVACYAVAFAFVARRQGLRRNFYFYTSLALILVIVSTALLLDGARLPLLWMLCAVLASWLAFRIGRVALDFHAAAYAIAAMGAAGVLTMAGYGWIGSADAPWPALAATALLVLASGFVCWTMPRLRSETSSDMYSRLPRLLIAMTLVWAVGGWMVVALVPPLAGVPGQNADAGAIATIRTSVISAVAFALAWAGRQERVREAAWLLYPVLVAGAVKMLAEDLPRSKPATLFVALALYGCALIAAPRIARVARRDQRSA